jgi:twitching motility protein PilT
MIFTDLINWAITQQASDIHLSPNKSVWLRCQGKMCEYADKKFSTQELNQFFKSMLNPEQATALQQQNYLDIANSPIEGIRLRINLFQQLQGLSAVIRIVPQEIPTLTELAAPKVIYEFIREHQGLILVTGPTGSGKSTTLAAMIAEINQSTAKHILTLEDPIEFIHPAQKSLITQRECHTHFQDYPHALRSALREDPDVILIGELRDAETIQLALTAAETGHLVLATLHTRTAASTVNRIIEVFAGEKQTLVRQLLADTLVAVISQRLITKTHKRQAIFEILRATPAVRQLIREQNTSQLITAMQTGAAHGMQVFQELTPCN